MKRIRLRVSKLVLVLLIFLIIVSSIQMNPNISEAKQYTGTVGYLDNDVNPSTGAIQNWGYSQAVALDYQYRSIGIDLGNVKTLNLVRLIEDTGPSRIKKSDLSLYTSPDNVHYTKVDDWDFYKKDNVITLYNLSLTDRYVKIHGHFEDGNFSFSNTNLQNMVEVEHLPPNIWTGHGGSEWTDRKPIKVRNPNDVDVYDRTVYVSKSFLETSKLIAEGKMQPDFRDVRFADQHDRELHFYMDDDGFYIRIPHIAAQSSEHLFMYFGNPNAQFRGDGEGTFEVAYGNRTILDHTNVSLNYRDNMTIALLKDGTLMAIANTTSSSTKGIYRKFSYDNGQTWTTPEEIINLHDAGRDEPGSLLVDPDTGDVYLFFYSYYYYNPTEGDCTELAHCRNDLYVSKSTDNGVTWSEPRQIETGSSYNLTYSNPIKISNGDIVVPFHHVVSSDGAFAQSVVYSTDNGNTWEKSDTDLTLGGAAGFEAGLTEAAIIELDNHDLKMYMRQQQRDKKVLAESVSKDNGRTWSPVTDSKLFSPNTMPAMRKHTNGDILLLWAGNNSFGGDSYARNPFSLVYSSDNTETWNGYRDILAGTSLSTPDRSAKFTQPNFVRAEDGSYVFTWWGDEWSKAYTLRIEDFDNYLYRSHGVFDGFEHQDLASDDWWSVFDTVETSMNYRKSGDRSLRLRDNNTDTLTQGTRLFPAIRKGTVQFQLYPERLDSEFTFALNEPYSHGHHEPGTLFEFIVKKDGSLMYFDSDGTQTELPVETDLSLNTWHQIELNFDVASKEIEVLVNGENKGTVGNYKQADVITNFTIASGSTPGTGTDVYIDDLRIQETTLAPLTASNATQISDVEALIEQYVQSGDLKTPVAKPLKNKLRQAQHHLERGSSSKAIKHMEDFLKHLHNEAMQKFLSEEAKEVLDQHGNELIQLWAW